MKTSMGKLSVESENIFPIIRDKLYDTQDAFLRELAANGVDAITRRQTLIQRGTAEAAGEPFRIRVLLDTMAGTLTIQDNGVGMTEEELDRCINDIAFSGTREFLTRLAEDERGGGQLIGQFGLGFYSAFMAANVVEIETLSWQPGAAAVHWVCNSSTLEYAIKPGTRTQVGTSIVLHLLPDSVFLQPAVVQKGLKKYCSFLPVDLYFVDSAAPERELLLSDRMALWTRKPSELTRADYLDFYHRQFEDAYEPVAWLNLYNEALGVRGVLYFRHIDDSASSITGDVRLYSRQIYIGSNVGQVIPDFLSLQNGIVDIRGLPLSVSRTSVKEDGYAAAVADYLAAQVGGFLRALLTHRREKYEGMWPELSPFVKLGILQNRRFKSQALKSVLFQTGTGTFRTLEELRGGESGTEGAPVYYVSDPVGQAQYAELYRKAGVETVLLPHVVDTPFVRLLELENPGLTFRRLDADLSALLSLPECCDGAAREKDAQTLRTVYGTLLDQKGLELRAEYLKSPEITALILRDEQLRRQQEVAEAYNLSIGLNGSGAVEVRGVFVLNLNAPLVRGLIAHPEHPAGGLIARQLLDMARLGQGMLEETDMLQYLEDSGRILRAYAEAAMMKG